MVATTSPACPGSDGDERDGAHDAAQDHPSPSDATRTLDGQPIVAVDSDRLREARPREDSGHDTTHIKRDSGLTDVRRPDLPRLPASDSRLADTRQPDRRSPDIPAPDTHPRTPDKGAPPPANIWCSAATPLKLSGGGRFTTPTIISRPDLKTHYRFSLTWPAVIYLNSYASGGRPNSRYIATTAPARSPLSDRPVTPGMVERTCLRPFCPELTSLWSAGQPR